MRFIEASNNNIRELKGHLEELLYADFSNNETISLKALAKSKDMRVLILDNTRLQDLQSFHNFKYLLYLSMRNADLQNINADFLGDCQYLLYLNISYNMYSTMPDLPFLILRELDLSGNDFQNFRLSSWCPMLRVLRLNNCKIEKLAPFTSAPFLEHICLHNNLIAGIWTHFDF